MRSLRLAFAIVFAAVALSTTACTSSPTGPTPSSDDIMQPGI
jgi:hypothetical protein